MSKRTTLGAIANAVVNDMIGTLQEEICSRCLSCMGSCPAEGSTDDDRCYEKGRFDDLEEIGKTIQRIIGHIM